MECRCDHDVIWNKAGILSVRARWIGGSVRHIVRYVCLRLHVRLYWILGKHPSVALQVTHASSSGRRKALSERIPCCCGYTPFRRRSGPLEGRCTLLRSWSSPERWQMFGYNATKRALVDRFGITEGPAVHLAASFTAAILASQRSEHRSMSSSCAISAASAVRTRVPWTAHGASPAPRAQRDS